MNIAISGASGCIGNHLTDYVSALGNRVISLNRPLVSDGFFGELVQAVEHSDVVINLAGSSISQRWSEAAMQEMVEGRIQTTRLLVDAIKGANHKPKLFLSIPAVGYFSRAVVSHEY